MIALSQTDTTLSSYRYSTCVGVFVQEDGGWLQSHQPICRVRRNSGNYYQGNHQIMRHSRGSMSCLPIFTLLKHDRNMWAYHVKHISVDFELFAPAVSVMIVKPEKFHGVFDCCWKMMLYGFETNLSSL